MKENKNNELSMDSLEQVAGGHFNDRLVQSIMKLDGFKDEWTKVKEGVKWDKDFLKFLSDKLGSGLAHNATVTMYGSQQHMFSKDGKSHMG